MKGAIFDEAQRVPELFSYLQQILDENPAKGQFILAYMYLLPFSNKEAETLVGKRQTLEEAIFNGGYPAIYDNKIAPNKWLPDYISTYVERDIRKIKNINDLATFEKFIKLCAGRVGQLLNMSSLAIEAG